MNESAQKLLSKHEQVTVERTSESSTRGAHPRHSLAKNDEKLYNHLISIVNLTLIDKTMITIENKSPAKKIMGCGEGYRRSDVDLL